MNEEAAKEWMRERFGVDRTDAVAVFLELVSAENTLQNLVAPSTIETIWARHAVDSAQLIGLVKEPQSWLDVGTGGGFPGMIVALLLDIRVVMVEPRKRRAAFLTNCALTLGLEHRATVIASRIEQVSAKAHVISARAVASVEKLLQATAHCATSETRWVLPRGRVDEVAIADLRRIRGRMFHVEHSLTDPDSVILIVEDA